MDQDDEDMRDQWRRGLLVKDALTFFACRAHLPDRHKPADRSVNIPLRIWTARAEPGRRAMGRTPTRGKVA